MRPWVPLFLLALVALPLHAMGQDTAIATIEKDAHASLVYANVEQGVDIALGPDGTLYYASFGTGELREIKKDGTRGTLWTAPNLQLGGERGFVGLALAPDFADSGAFYVNYQTNKSGTVVTRLSRVVDGVETVLLDDIRSGKLHNSGRIAFMPDGNLLMSVGDATLDTIGRNASMHAHDETDLNGKVLRLTPEGKPAPGNPWGNEVWTKGHRNVYGLAVSPDGIVIGTENGPDHEDEINVLQAGKDYGWPTCSGPCVDPKYTNPVLHYYDTISPTGAIWYEGAFYFTDFNKGSIHRIAPLPNGTWTDDRVLKLTTPRIIDIAVGPDGLYFSTWDSVWKLTLDPTLPRVTPTVSTPTATPSTPPTASPGLDPEAAVGGSGVPGLGVWAVALVAAAAWMRGRR